MKNKDMILNGKERMAVTIKKIKLTAKFVIGHLNGEHIIYEDGEVVYQGNKVIYVGKDYADSVDEIWEQGLSIISPGFIDLDADIDSDHALMDIAVPDNNDKFVMGAKYRTYNPFSDKDLEARQRLSIAQLIKNGITTALPITGENFYEWNHSLHECSIMEKVAKEMGIRIYIGPSFKSRMYQYSEDDKEREKRSVTEALDFCKNHPYDEENLINAFVNPCQISITSLETLKEMAYFAQKNKFPYRLHACEAIREWNYTLPKYRKTTIQLLYDEKMLFNQFIIPHAITVTNEELKLLAETQTSIVNTPLADANFGTALFSFAKYSSYGVNHTMGTDTQPLDMIRNLRMAWDLDRLCWRRKFFSKYEDIEDGKIIPLLPDEPTYPKTTGGQIFNAATINGAKALARNDIGKLEIGAKADIIVIDLNHLSVGPYQDPIRTLINSCNGNHVKHTIINGVVRMKDRKLINFDEQKILEEAQESFERFINLYKEFDVFERDVNITYPPTYKII